jgi:hypothetical protein
MKARQPDQCLLFPWTILPDQFDNLLQEQVLFRRKSVWKCLCNKATDFPVNTIPVVRSDMLFHNFQSVIVRYVASDRLGNLVQDHVEVYDIAYQASNIFLAGERDKLLSPDDTSRCSLSHLPRNAS